VRPVVVARVQGLLDEQTAEARTVNKQVTLDALARRQRDGLDKATLLIGGDARNASFLPYNSVLLCDLRR
jgi:hypothetical protein